MNTEEKNKIRTVIDIIPPRQRVVMVDSGEIRPEVLAGEPELRDTNPEPPAVQTPEPEAMENLIDDIVSEPVSHHEALESLLNEGGDPVVELASIGAVIAESRKYKVESIKYQDYDKREKPEDNQAEELYQRVISHIRAPISSSVATLSSIKPPTLQQSFEPRLVKAEFVAVGEEVSRAKITGEKRSDVADFYQRVATPAPKELIKIKSLKSKHLDFSPARKKNFSTLLFIVFGAFGLIAYGFSLKNEVMRDGAMALENLEQAQENLKNFNFADAAESFKKSYEDFSQARQNLNFAGAGLAGIFSDLPGVGKIKSAKDIVESGKLLADAGRAMSEALSILSKTGSILNPHDGNKTKPIKIVNKLRDALELSSRNFNKAKALILAVDESIIPEDRLQNFRDFKDKIPMFEKILGDAVEYSDFFQSIIGIDEPKKYLLLFQNYSELRPTGGFPGTYGVVSFASGGLADFFVDDIYNLDGQLKKNIIPPKQLQHITPTWGMRDSAWFIDFPTSAKKTMWFFAQEAGYDVDGIIALNPDIISQILDVVGPIDMPEYDMKLTGDNFLASIQEEVEYGPNRTQPKKVVVDFAPRLLDKLYSADSEKWTKIFDILMAGLEEKDMLFYFDDKAQEEFTVSKGFGGEVKNPSTSSGQASDYLMVNFSNVKGSKTDVVTDSSIAVDSRIEGGKMVHKVTVTRDHNGGDREHGFYNRQNPAYVRVLMPKDAELLSIYGNDLPNFKPLVSYGMLDFVKDRDLENLESGFYFDKTMNVDKYEESGKKGIGFWMITNPNSEKKVEFEYAVPFDGEDYNFYFQKQPGIDWKNFKFTINKSGGVELLGSSPTLNKFGDLYMLESELKKDLNLNIKFK